ncbi:MAG: hypothetical protein ACM3SP_14960 [Chloroflexota bacterium]
MAAGATLAYTMFVEVYLHAAVVRGILETNQDRLSNYFAVRQGEEVFALKDATLQVDAHEPVSVGSREYLLYMQEVLLIADLGAEDPGRRVLPGLFVKKEKSKALLSVGPYLLQGNVHLQSGSALQEFLVEKNYFLPITEAILLGRQDVGPRTYLVNRAKIGFIAGLGEDLVEF